MSNVPPVLRGMLIQPHLSKVASYEGASLATEQGRQTAMADFTKVALPLPGVGRMASHAAEGLKAFFRRAPTAPRGPGPTMMGGTVPGVGAAPLSHAGGVLPPQQGLLHGAPPKPTQSAGRADPPLVNTPLKEQVGAPPTSPPATPAAPPASPAATGAAVDPNAAAKVRAAEMKARTADRAALRRYQEHEANAPRLFGKGEHAQQGALLRQDALHAAAKVQAPEHVDFNARKNMSPQELRRYTRAQEDYANAQRLLQNAANPPPPKEKWYNTQLGQMGIMMGVPMALQALMAPSQETQY